MAKFAIECPKCGSINQASTFIFAKKAIQCGTCGEEINIKASRLISKECPHCHKVFVCDQAKIKDKRCPSCGKPIDVLQAATAKYKMVTLNCPQCACAIDVDGTKPEYFCPICNCQIDVKKEILKSKMVSDTGVSVIQYEGDNETFIWKHPIEDFNLGSQLIVHESQEAIFFLNGEALDSFGPGRHTLETENLPVMKKIYDLPTGSQTPFHAEVYFINLTVQMGMKWGTDSRVRFIDPETGIPLDIGASGEMNICVSDPRKLLIKLVGTANGLVNKHVLESEGKDGEAVKSIRGFFRAPLMTQIKSYLASTIKEQKLNIMEIDENLGILSEALKTRVVTAFEEYGLTIPQFYVTNISLPEDDPNYKKIKELRARAYLGVKEEETEATVAEASRKRQIIEAQTAAQLKILQAQAEAEAKKATGFADAEILRTQGLAEADVMRQKGYTQKDVLQADVQKAYAEGLGNMGSGGGNGGNGGGNGGGMASELVSAMIGMNMAGKVMNQMDFNVGIPQTEPIAPIAAAAAKWTCSCGETENVKAFCMSCGKPKPEPVKAGGWKCPNCGESGITSAFCPSCGNKKPEDTAWNCPACGATGITSAFCPDCGGKKPE